MKLEKYIEQCQTRVNKVLNNALPRSVTEPKNLHRAMRYAALNGGKRLRSALIYSVGEAMGAKPRVLDTCSAAIELVHSFSLIHDDLPAIDNDDLRRGKPSCHIAFDEATAILAGDALLTLAFELLAKIDSRSIQPSVNLKMVELLSHSVGSLGMAGGEALDVALKDDNISLQKLANIYKLKTSYLICASILLGALSANCNRKLILNRLEKFGLYLGLAFQIHDDIIEIESDEKTLGKSKDSDQRNAKPTYPAMIGLDAAKRKETFCYNKAKKYLSETKIHSEIIIDLSEYIINRKY